MLCIFRRVYWPLRAMEIQVSPVLILLTHNISLASIPQVSMTPVSLLGIWVEHVINHSCYITSLKLYMSRKKKYSDLYVE